MASKCFVFLESSSIIMPPFCKFCSRLVYDSCQINQFNHGKMWKCIDSITMNRYNLNISINSIMLLSTYESTQSSQKNDTNDSINSINGLNISTQSTQSTQFNTIFCWPFLGKPSISLTFFWENVRFLWPFLDILNQFNWFNQTSP